LVGGLDIDDGRGDLTVEQAGHDRLVGLDVGDHVIVTPSAVDRIA